MILNTGCRDVLRQTNKYLNFLEKIQIGLPDKILCSDSDPCEDNPLQGAILCFLLKLREFYFILFYNHNLHSVILLLLQ